MYFRKNYHILYIFFYFYFRYLIESLQRSYLNTIPGSKQLDSVSKETTPFNQIFGGYIRQEVTCLRCKHVSTTYQRFMDILVEIQQANTIEDALVQFFKQKRLGQPGDPASLYKCEKCKLFLFLFSILAIFNFGNLVEIQ